MAKTYVRHVLLCYACRRVHSRIGEGARSYYTYLHYTYTYTYACALLMQARACVICIRVLLHTHVFLLSSCRRNIEHFILYIYIYI